MVEEYVFKSHSMTIEKPFYDWQELLRTSTYYYVCHVIWEHILEYSILNSVVVVEETRSALGAARGEEQAEPQGFIDQIWTKFTSNVP